MLWKEKRLLLSPMKHMTINSHASALKKGLATDIVATTVKKRSITQCVFLLSCPMHVFFHEGWETQLWGDGWPC